MKLYPTLAVIATTSILVGIVGNWNGDFVWDEKFWIDNLRVFEQYGLSKEFLLGMKTQAPGPLWQVIHSLFEPITNLYPARMRLLNFALALAMLCVLGRAISQWKAIGRPQLVAFTVLCVPGITLLAGMAMTEIPTLLFAVGHVDVTLRYILTSDRRMMRRLGMAALAGVLLGVTVLGRANFLAMAFAAPCLMILPRVRADWKIVTIGSLLTLCVALAISGPVFWTWKGLVPPDAAAHVHLSLNFWNAILASIQLTVVVLVLSPSWFVASQREYKAWSLFGFVLFAVNCAWLGWEHQSATVGSALGRVGAVDAGGLVVALATPAAFTAYCCFFFVRAIRHAFEHCREAVPLYGFCISTLLVAGTMTQNVNFGVRSTAQIAPFLVMALAPRVLSDRGAFPVKLLGLAVGNLFLWERLT